MLEKIEKLLKAIKQKNILPSIKQTPVKLPKPISTGAKPVKLPGLKPASAKNPVKQAEQIKDENMKDDKMNEAKEKMSVNKSTGQWSIEKSGYSGYDEKSNIKRKQRNMSEEGGIKTMSRIKQWSSPSAEREKEKEVNRFNRKSPVKEWSKQHGWHKKDKKGNVVPLD